MFRQFPILGRAAAPLFGRIVAWGRRGRVRADLPPLVPLTSAQAVANARRIVRNFGQYARDLSQEEATVLFRSASSVVRADRKVSYQPRACETPEDAA